jgi:Trk K+ transport system NAD-binding subunit
LALYNIITLIAADYIKKLIKLEDFTKLNIMSDFAISIIQTIITASKDIEENSIQKLQAVQFWL